MSLHSGLKDYGLTHSIRRRILLSHELGSEWASERTNECSGAREQCGASEGVSGAREQKIESANGPDVFVVILPTVHSLVRFALPLWSTPRAITSGNWFTSKARLWVGQKEFSKWPAGKTWEAVKQNNKWLRVTTWQEMTSNDIKWH